MGEESSPKRDGPESSHLSTPQRSLLSSQATTTKKRRLDAATKTLARPFKTPIINKSANKDSASQQKSFDFRSKASPNLFSSSTSAKLPSKSESPYVPTATNVILTPQSSPMRHKAPHLVATPSPALLSSSVRKDPEYAAAVAKSAVLNSDLRSLQQDIDTIIQATQLLKSGQDDRLELLVDKWRSASQGAADDVYARVRERVQRMGGVQAWRQGERDRMKDWGADEEAESAQLVRDEDYEEYQQAKKEKERREKEEQLNDQEEEYTMDMMLKTLNIDAKLIGYDADQLRWG